MPRRRTRVGDHGDINTTRLPSRRWQAFTRVRDPDGKLRSVKRQGLTKAEAEDNLTEALRQRHGVGGKITGDSPLTDVAEDWLTDFTERVAVGERAPNTLRVYQVNLRKHILPALGDIPIGELGVPQLNRYIQAVRRNESTATALTSRTILSDIFERSVAVYGVPRTNPVRDVMRIPRNPKRKARALTDEERVLWLKRLREDKQAVDREIPEITAWLLATGVRIGEALAVSFQDINFAKREVEINYNLVRIPGEGLRRMRTKSAAGERTLKLPSWVMPMLLERYEAYGEGPLFPALQARGWRDPSNTAADIREARDKAGFGWVTSHNFRKTVATVLDKAGLTGREVADQLGHSKVSLTQDVYMGREATTDRHVTALESLGESVP